VRSPIIPLAVKTSIDRRDGACFAVMAVSFACGLWISWQRWGNPLVDCGREMNEPLRLAQGQMLYSDVRHIYGPLSPYLNAGLFKIFGPSLAVLCGDGIVTAMIIVVLVYWLARRLMGRVESTAAALSVMWLCAFKQAGNYILPYSFAALHGSAFGLLALTLILAYVDIVTQTDVADRKLTPHLFGRRSARIVAAGLLTGLALLAKTEMGIPPLLTGVLAVVWLNRSSPRLLTARLSAFIVPAAAIVLAAYGVIAARIGVRSLFGDSFLLLINMPSELAYFNKRMSGFDDTIGSLIQIAGMSLRVGLFAATVGLLSLAISRSRKGNENRSNGKPNQTGSAQLSLMTLVAAFLFVAVSFAGRMQLEKGPYLAMPVILIALIIAEFRSLISRGAGKRESINSNSITVLLLSVYAITSLVRVLLRVRSGGAYASYLLPVSVILFVLCASRIGPDLLKQARAVKLARGIMLTIIFMWIAATAAVFAGRYKKDNTFTLATSRGTMLVANDLGAAFKQAIEFVESETAPNDSLVVLPEGTSINFFTGRPNPLREEITTPGFLDDEGEKRAIHQIEQADTRFIFIANRPTPEFGAVVFGRDYCKHLMGWIEQNYSLCAVFGKDTGADSEIGDRTFFIKAYRKKS